MSGETSAKQGATLQGTFGRVAARTDTRLNIACNVRFAFASRGFTTRAFHHWTFSRLKSKGNYITMGWTLTVQNTANVVFGHDEM